MFFLANNFLPAYRPIFQLYLEQRGLLNDPISPKAGHENILHKIDEDDQNSKSYSKISNLFYINSFIDRFVRQKIPRSPPIAKKRRLLYPQGSEVHKGGFGAIDSENVWIVNLKDVDKLSYPEIVKIVNNRRIKEGRNPSLTVNAVTSRYNRNAPLFYVRWENKLVSTLARQVLPDAIPFCGGLLYGRSRLTTCHGQKAADEIQLARESSI